MVRAGWVTVEAQLETRKNIWQHSSRVEASRASDQDQGDQAKERRVLAVPAREKVAAYRRTITAQDVTYTCARCSQEVTKALFPGRTPLYCDDCAKEVEREKTRARVTRLRAGRKAEKEIVHGNGTIY